LPVPATTLMAFISQDVVTPPLPPAPPMQVNAGAPPPPSDVANLDPNLAPIVSPDAIGAEPVRETTKGLIRGVEASDGAVLDGAIGSVVNHYCTRRSWPDSCWRPSGA